MVNPCLQLFKWIGHRWMKFYVSFHGLFHSPFRLHKSCFNNSRICIVINPSLGYYLIIIGDYPIRPNSIITFYQSSGIIIFIRSILRLRVCKKWHPKPIDVVRTISVTHLRNSNLCCYIAGTVVNKIMVNINYSADIKPPMHSGQP